MNKISVIGLGKLGLPLAVCLASKGFQVIGVDTDEQKIKAINNRKAPVNETNLQEMLTQYKDLIIAISEYDSAIKNSEVTFVVTNTPSNPDGSYSTKQLESACQGIGNSLRDKDAFHVVAIVSTVLPLTCEEKLKPILEKSSGKKCGVSFGLCYTPEFIALGSVISNFLNPDFFLIGESDQKSGEMVGDIYRKISNSKIVRTSIVNAELIKIALNCFLTMKISFANTLKEVCEKLPNANVDEVLSTLALDHRISAGCLRAGLGFGGPCFPRDNKAFSFLTKQLSCQSWLAEATDRVNNIQAHKVAENVKHKLSQGTVAILGLSYKPNTNVIEASQSIEIATKLVALGYRVKVYDPQALNNAKPILGDDVIYSDSLQGCLDNADLCVIATPWNEFKNLKINIPTIDPWSTCKD